MALVNRSFSVNVTPGMMPPIVHVSEYDVGRAYTVSIIDEQGNPFTIPSGTTASIEGTLNGKVGFTQSASISNNQVSFTLTESMTAYSGKAWCKIKLTQNSQPIQTCAFVLAVDLAGVEADTILHSPGFQEQINEGIAEYFDNDPPFFELPEGGQSGQPLLSDGADGAVWGRSGTYIEARTADPVSGLVTGRVWLVSQDVPTPPTPPTPSTLVYSLNNAVMPPAVVTAETLDVSGAFTIFADFSPSSSIYGSNTSEKFVWVSGHSVSIKYARRIGVQKWKATYLLYAELSNDFNASYTDIQIPYSAQRCKVAISKQANSSTIDIYTQYDSSSVVKTTFQTSGSDYFNDVIHIGELYDSTNAFAGTFNSFKWFSDALSENQILALFNG